MGRKPVGNLDLGLVILEELTKEAFEIELGLEPAWEPIERCKEGVGDNILEEILI